jgi:hypothetical protein
LPETSAIVIGDAAVGQREDVVVVAAHLGRGPLAALHHEASRAHRCRRQQRALDLLRELHLVREPLALEQVRLRRAQTRDHVIDRVGEQPELGAVAERERGAQVPAADALDAGAQRLDRAEEERHEHDRRCDAQQQQHAEHHVLLAPAARDRALDGGEPEPDDGGPDHVPIPVADRRRGDQQLVVAHQGLARIERDRGGRRPQRRRARVVRADAAHLGVALDHAGAIHAPPPAADPSAPRSSGSRAARASARG